MRHCVRLALYAALLGVLAACGAPQAHASSQVPNTVPRLGAAQQQPTPSSAPSPTATPPPPVISLWFPALLSYEAELHTAALFSELLNDYSHHSGHTVNLRLRRTDGLGGIFETLNSTARVAPSALPDMVLLRARDLPRAAAARLVFPLEASLLREEAYFTTGLVLGQFEGTQYGIPYLLEMQHTVYRGEGAPPTSLSTLISRQLPYLFTAKVSKGANSTLLSHYVTLGGRLNDQNGDPLLDYEPLLAVMTLYAEAHTAGSLPDDVLDYAEFAQYWSPFVAGKNALVQVDSTFFLRQRALANSSVAETWQVAALPRISSETPPLSIVDGWLWVLTTEDTERQNRALALLRWLKDAPRFAEFSQQVGMLPSQRAALAAWEDSAYATFAAALLDRALVPLVDTVNLTAAEALQENFARILKGEADGENAANTALERVRNARER